MAVGDPASERTLEYTPAWALATVSTVFILISIAVERSLHVLGHYLRRSKKKSLELALLKLKDELMLMGFISLTITIITTPVSKLCVKSSSYNKWTPCNIRDRPNYNASYTSQEVDAGRRRLLAAAVGTNYCKDGYEPFVSTNTLHQLHILIFILAGVHVAYSCLTMVLSLTKVYSWRKWEKEAHEAVAQQNATEFTSNINYSRQSTFVRYHTSKPLGVKLLVWVVCFFKQFYVRRVDYLTLRLSFVTTHNLRDNYNFHAYMIRCMEDEFETLVGITIWLWGFVIAYLLFSVTEPRAYYWGALVPLLVVLIIGMKLQHVIATLALEHSGVNGPFVGVLLKPRDQLFWFNRPKFLLYIIHFILFESAFELATFIWHVWQFNFKTCLLEDNKTHLYFRLLIGVVTQLLCCFITLPLYSLVSQMSTMPKKAFLPKRVTRGLLKWHAEAKTRLKIKVLETYQNQRLARLSITPLDEQYFLRTNSPVSPGGVLAITNGHHGHPTSSPMNINMEEGRKIHGNKIQKDEVSLYRVSPPHGDHEEDVEVIVQSQSHHQHHHHLHQNEASDGNSRDHLNGGHLRSPIPYGDHLRKRGAPSPRGHPMNLVIPPFQGQQQTPSPRPLQRSSTTN